MPADVPYDLQGYRRRQAQLPAMVQVMLQLEQVRRARLVHLRFWQFGFKLRVFLSSYALLQRNSCLRRDPQPSGN